MLFRAFVMAACALAAALCPAGPGPALAAAAAPRTTLPAPEPAPAPDGIDFDRLTTDRQYATEILAQLDRIGAAAADDAEVRAAVDSLRLIALATLQRRDEIRATVERLLAGRPREAGAYSGAIYAAAVAPDPELLLTVIETASRNVPGVGWPELRTYLDPEVVGPLFGHFQTHGQPELRLRLAEALFRIGWPGDGDVATADSLRSMLLDDRLQRGDSRAAADLAGGITSPDTIVTMIVQPRYDAVLAPGRDRLDVLRDALAAHDRATADALAASPAHKRRLLERVQLLRSVGRNADALTLLGPHISDARATAAESEDGMWLVNEAAFALVALDRHAEALALTAPLAELPLDEYPYMISISINHAEILFGTGRHAEALAHATALEAGSGDYSSDYGKMWIASAIVCSLAGLDRAAEAAPQLERMRPLSDVNPAALTEAYLCLDDGDAAAALMVRRLEGDDPAAAILALQDYPLSRGVAQVGERYARLTALRERPEVRAALARVGRLLTLPLARTYWGNF